MQRWLALLGGLLLLAGCATDPAPSTGRDDESGPPKAASRPASPRPPLSAAAQRQLLDWVPFAGPRNPVDITAQVTNDDTLLERSATLMLNDQPFHSWLGFFAAAGLSPTVWPSIHALVKTLRAQHPDTLLAVSTLCSDERRQELEALRCLVFSDPGIAIRCIGALTRWGTQGKYQAAQGLQLGAALVAAQRADRQQGVRMARAQGSHQAHDGRPDRR